MVKVAFSVAYVTFYVESL